MRLTTAVRAALAFVAAWALATADAGVAGAQTAAVPRNSVWLYDDTGTDLGQAWRDPGYDDSGWASGPGILGYGEPYITTVVSDGGDSGNKNTTTYFRSSFFLNEDPPDVLSLLLELNYDDGCVVYLNGSEVARRSLPAGPVSYSTFASSHEGGGYETIDLSGFIGLLAFGSNWLAVEVHQTTPSSSDLVFDLGLLYSTTSASVTRGPYLQSATDTSVVVRWRTGVPTTSAVRFGSSPGSLDEIVSDGASVQEHELPVGGLDPDSRYYYTVGTTDASLTTADSTHFLTTSPVPGTDRPVRVWIIGDSGTANSNAAVVRDAYLSFAGSEHADLWLMLGDNAYSTGTDAEYQAAVFDMYPSLLRNTPLWPTRGNHDALHPGSWNDYYEIFTLPTAGEAGGLASTSEAYYSYDFCEVHFVCLDSEGSSRAPGSPMLTWLDDDLAATTRRWIVAYWHHPPYTKGSHDSDDPLDSGGRMRDMRENVLPILESRGVDLVLTGHSHSYERSFLLDEHYGTSASLHDSMKVDAGDGREEGDGPYEKPSPGPAPHEGAVYVVAGSSGQTSGGMLNHPVMVASLNVLGSMLLEVDGDRLDALFLDASGSERDHFTMRKGVGVGVGPPASGAGVHLSAPIPNPATSGVRFEIELPRAAEARLALYDAAGRRVATLAARPFDAGRHAVAWDGRDARGNPAGAGVYFAVLEALGETRVRKVVWER